MPRIVVTQTQGNLTRALFHLGLVDLFTPGHANLFGVSSFGWLHVTNVTHAAYVEVREGPGEAQENGGGTDGAPIKVILDRPFLWFIMDNVAGLAIAMGKMARPDTDLVQQVFQTAGPLS